MKKLVKSCWYWIASYDHDGVFYCHTRTLNGWSGIIDTDKVSFLWWNNSKISLNPWIKWRKGEMFSLMGRTWRGSSVPFGRIACMKSFRHLAKMQPGCLPCESLWPCPSRKRHHGRPKTLWTHILHQPGQQRFCTGKEFCYSVLWGTRLSVRPIGLVDTSKWII